MSYDDEYTPAFDLEAAFPDADDARYAWQMSTLRRVLGHVTDEEHVGRGPRNTLDRLTVELGEDPNTAIDPGETDAVQNYLDILTGNGLLKQRKNGSYQMTAAGMYELTH